MTTPVQLRPAESAGRRALWLAFAAAVMTFLLPLAGLVMSVFALVVSVRAVPALRSVPKPIGTAVAGVVVSVMALLLSTGAAALQFYLRDEYAAYDECMKGAGTVTAREGCVNQLEQAIREKIPVLDRELTYPFAP
ncbi:hypothetical protein ACFOWE_06235 [Planomonospora corallina]|uniref:DUF4190 domain-containing protein n=1 Tax=Planomonospora corallina TaxID=1806052 RepID=A0ABV8I645_9ACTN